MWIKTLVVAGLFPVGAWGLYFAYLVVFSSDSGFGSLVLGGLLGLVGVSMYTRLNSSSGRTYCFIVTTLLGVGIISVSAMMFLLTESRGLLDSLFQSGSLYILGPLVLAIAAGCTAVIHSLMITYRDRT